MVAFSIITPCFNSEKYLTATLESALVQTFPDWELIIVDDGSSDDTIGIAEEYARSDCRIQLIRLPYNNGAARARNAGIQAATGRYISFLDSDDIWYPEKLSAQLQLFEKTRVPLAYGAYDVINETGERIASVTAPNSVVYSDLLMGCPIGCLTAAFDTKLVGKLYMPEFRQRQDWGLWLRILRGSGVAQGSAIPYAALRRHRKSMTYNKVRATYYTWRLLLEETELGPLGAARGTLSHVLSSIGRRWRRE